MSLTLSWEMSQLQKHDRLRNYMMRRIHRCNYMPINAKYYLNVYLVPWRQNHHNSPYGCMWYYTNFIDHICVRLGLAHGYLVVLVSDEFKLRWVWLCRGQCLIQLQKPMIDKGILIRQKPHDYISWANQFTNKSWLNSLSLIHIWRCRRRLRCRSRWSPYH